MLRLSDESDREPQEIPFPRELHPKHFLFWVNRDQLCKSWLELLVTWRMEMIFLFWRVQLSLKKGAEENPEFCYARDRVNEGKLRWVLFIRFQFIRPGTTFFRPCNFIALIFLGYLLSESKHWYPRFSRIRKSLHIFICIRNNTAHSHPCKHSELFRFTFKVWKHATLGIHFRTLRISGVKTQLQQSYKAFPAGWGWMFTWEAEAGRL